MIKKVNILFFLLLVLTNLSCALKAESSDYSASLFGTGIQAGNSSSDDMKTDFVLLYDSSTGGAESDDYTANIGFWENSQYHRTVSIVSYSISPSSAVIGSTIGLYISALNYESLWAKIISPNSQEQILMLTNDKVVNYLPSPSIVGRYEVIFYANSSSGAVSSAIGYFDLIEEIEEPEIEEDSGGSSGGGTTIIEKCTYNWDCTPWGICSDGKQKRECKNIGTCNGTESRPVEEMGCSESLFDISVKLNDIYLDEKDFVRFNVELIDKMSTEKIDVHVKYSIIDNAQNEVFSRIETLAVEGTLSYESVIDDIILKDGDYTLRVDILYGNLQRAFAEHEFSVGEKGDLTLEEPQKPILSILAITNFIKINYGLLLFLPIILGMFMLLFFRREGSLSKVRKYSLYGMFVLLIITSFAVIANPGITGRAVETDIISDGSVIIPVAILFFLALIIMAGRKIVKKISNKNFSTGRPRKNTLKGLMHKRIYTDSGRYIGRVSEIILGKNRIDSLKIKIDKKHKFKLKGVSVNYKYVKSVDEVIIIDARVIEYL